jgi:hypothetical protein
LTRPKHMKVLKGVSNCLRPVLNMEVTGLESMRTTNALDIKLRLRQKVLNTDVLRTFTLQIKMNLICQSGKMLIFLSTIVNSKSFNLKAI